tara:strand:+ start:573 stop:791 length:219 start_codon:yes stop_codon:yes gene_type:complete
MPNVYLNNDEADIMIELLGNASTCLALGRMEMSLSAWVDHPVEERRETVDKLLRMRDKTQNARYQSSFSGGG